MWAAPREPAVNLNANPIALLIDTAELTVERPLLQWTTCRPLRLLVIAKRSMTVTRPPRRAAWSLGPPKNARVSSRPTLHRGTLINENVSRERSGNLSPRSL